MSITKDWTSVLDQLIVDAILAGRIRSDNFDRPDHHIETGLAHVFFFGGEVLKLYKTHHEIDHFILGVLAPTERRREFMNHDFASNRHFSQGTYRDLHSLYYRDGEVTIRPYDERSIHTVIVMDKLDFGQNLYEKMLTNDVTDTDLYTLGYETARLVSEHTVTVPSHITWYDQATRRINFLKQFIAWLPETYSQDKTIIDALTALDAHIAVHKDEYQSLTADQLTADLDNHDENVFIDNDTVRIIDTIPPMDCWWYGVSESNLTTPIVNVEAMLSPERAGEVRRGFVDFHGKDTLRENIFEFSRAFDYLISIAHYGSLPDKQAVAQKYVRGCADIPRRLAV